MVLYFFCFLRTMKWTFDSWAKSQQAFTDLYIMQRKDFRLCFLDIMDDVKQLSSRPGIIQDTSFGEW